MEWITGYSHELGFFGGHLEDLLKSCIELGEELPQDDDLKAVLDYL
jgi:hypothetical protein